MAKIKFDPYYRVPANRDGIYIITFIPRTILNEAKEGWKCTDPFDGQLLINILERSEYEIDTVPY